MPFVYDVILKELVGEQKSDYADHFSLSSQRPLSLLNVDLSTLSAATDAVLGFGDPIDEIVDLYFSDRRGFGSARTRLALQCRVKTPLFGSHKISVRSFASEGGPSQFDWRTLLQKCCVECRISIRSDSALETNSGEFLDCWFGNRSTCGVGGIAGRYARDRGTSNCRWAARYTIVERNDPG